LPPRLREPRERAAGATQSDPHKAPRMRGRPAGIEAISGAQLEVVEALASVSSSRRCAHLYALGLFVADLGGGRLAKVPSTWDFDCRGGRIRTAGLLLPKQARCQAALRPVRWMLTR
jgi:hypothetical protein